MIFENKYHYVSKNDNFLLQVTLSANRLLIERNTNLKKKTNLKHETILRIQIRPLNYKKNSDDVRWREINFICGKCKENLFSNVSKQFSEDIIRFFYRKTIRPTPSIRYNFDNFLYCKLFLCEASHDENRKTKRSLSLKLIHFVEIKIYNVI